MSHQPERKEKNCLNCGTIVAGRYCQVCGQENMVAKQSFGGLIKHFIYDVFHFDGKFFDTLKFLLFRPGYIPKQYIAGKRHSWLDPIRMYLFTSAIFFLVFFSITNLDKSINMDQRLMTKQERYDHASVINGQMNSGNGDSLLKKQLRFLLDTSYRIILVDSPKASNDSSFLIRFKNENLLMIADKKKPGNSGDIRVGSGWLNRQVEARWRAYKQKYGDDTRGMLSDIARSFLYKLPYMLFLSLPFFALILKLLYIRRKNFYYSDHAVFTLYHYIFSFILLLVFFLLGSLNVLSGWGIFNFIRYILILSGGVYLLIAMKRFYMQGKGKTFLKFLILNILGLIIMMLLFVLFLIFSIFQT